MPWPLEGRASYVRRPLGHFTLVMKAAASVPSYTIAQQQRVAELTARAKAAAADTR